MARWESFRVLAVTLPDLDIKGNSLVGLEAVRVYYLPLGSGRPSATEVLTKGEVVLEQRRPDLPSPGDTFRIDLKSIGRPAGWIVVSALRTGNVVGAPSETLAWLHPGI